MESSNLASEFLAITNTSDLEDALLFLHNTNNNLEKAIELFFDKGPKFFKPQPKNPSPPKNVNSKKAETELLAKKYEQFFLEKEKKNSGFFSIFFGSKGCTEADFGFTTKGAACDEIKELFQKTYKKSLKGLNGGRVGENLLKAKKNEKILAILIYLDSKELAETLIKLFENTQFSTLAQKSFHLIGLLASHADAKKLITEFPPAKAMPCFLFLTINILDKMQFIDFWTIPLEKNDYQEKFAEAVKMYNVQCQYEEKVKKNVEDEIRRKRMMMMPAPGLMWNPFLDNEGFEAHNMYETVPRSVANPIDRDLISQQNEDYQKAVELSKKQFEANVGQYGNNSGTAENKEEKKQMETKEQKEDREKKEKEEQKKKELEDRKRFLEEKMANELSQEGKEIIEVLFRMPNGKKITRNFDNERLIEGLFEFIEWNEMEEKPNQTIEAFDLIVTYPHLSLFELKQKKINEVFPGSTQETLQIKPLS